MGQQQLLLVILVTIIVGIATVVAINTFGSAADNANLDAVRQDIASIAASAQGFYMKPKMMDGGGRSFGGIQFPKIAFAASGDNGTTTAWNDNGKYVMTTRDTDQVLVITAHPASQVPGGTSTDTEPTDAAAGDQIVAEAVKDQMCYDANCAASLSY